MTQANNVAQLSSDIDSSGTLLASGGGTGLTSPGSSGNVLTSNGTAWVSSAPGGGGFPSGTLMLFQQTSAPTGWTKSTTHDNKALRVVSGTAGTGGSVDFTTAFGTPAVSGSVGATTLSTAQLASHSHPLTVSTASGNTADSGGGYIAATADGGANIWRTDPSTSNNVSIAGAGSGGSHTHSLSSATTTINVAYVDLIIASKD